MTGYTVHTGATKKFTEGWDSIFEKKTTGTRTAGKKKAGKKTSGAKAKSKGASAKKKAGKS